MASQRIDLVAATSQISEALTYDQDTGVLTWLTRPLAHFRNAHGWNTFNSRYAGKPAGCLSPEGYNKVRLNNGLFRADRVIWFYMTGTWPEGDVDHKDNNRSNDRWTNLRLATRSQNNMNRRQRSGTNGSLKGIYFDKRVGKWAAQIKADGRNKYLGSYTTQEEAHAAYCAAATEFFGEFARFS